VRGALAIAVCVFLIACQGSEETPDPNTTEPAPSATASATASPTASVTEPAVLMPDLVGLTSTEAMRQLGDLQSDDGVVLSLSWDRPVPVRCGMRPGTVARQRPAPGTVLESGAEVHIRTAALDLARFRGPCHPPDGNQGPVTGRDAELAVGFYRFAADPSLGAPFTDGPVWVGLEDGLASVDLQGPALADLSAWRIGTAYAERAGPFSALDILAGSGGYYALHEGIASDCSAAGGTAPSELADLRAISFTAPSDTTGACMEFWAVTLFLDEHDQIRGVALWLGSP